MNPKLFEKENKKSKTIIQIYSVYYMQCVNPYQTKVTLSHSVIYLVLLQSFPFYSNLVYNCLYSLVRLSLSLVSVYVDSDILQMPAAVGADNPSS